MSQTKGKGTTNVSLDNLCQDKQTAKEGSLGLMFEKWYHIKMNKTKKTTVNIWGSIGAFNDIAH